MFRGENKHMKKLESQKDQNRLGAVEGDWISWNNGLGNVEVEQVFRSTRTGRLAVKGCLSSEISLFSLLQINNGAKIVTNINTLAEQWVETDCGDAREEQDAARDFLEAAEVDADAVGEIFCALVDQMQQK
jgi:hypothetical protein